MWKATWQTSCEKNVSVWDIDIWSAPELSTITGESAVACPPLMSFSLATSLQPCGFTPGICCATTIRLLNGLRSWNWKNYTKYVTRGFYTAIWRVDYTYYLILEHLSGVQLFFESHCVKSSRITILKLFFNFSFFFTNRPVQLVYNPTLHCKLLMQLVL